MVAYMDESGISAGEDDCLAGGIIMPLDVAVQSRVRARVESVIREAFGARPVGIFHATDVLHGSGDFKGWSMLERKRLMVRMAMIPREFGLTVFAGNTDKTFRPYAKANEADRITNDEFQYSLAFGYGLAHVQSFMSRLAPHAHCDVIVEDNRDLRTWALFAYNHMNGPGFTWPSVSTVPQPGPFTHLTPPRFVAKTDEALLQLADMIVFIPRRLLGKKREAQALFDLFQEELYVLPHQRRTYVAKVWPTRLMKRSLKDMLLGGVSRLPLI